MPQLIIAEKPSVAQSIAKVLGVTGRCNGYLENSTYIVSWCVGHLVELAPPGVYNENYTLVAPTVNTGSTAELSDQQVLIQAVIYSLFLAKFRTI